MTRHEVQKILTRIGFNPEEIEVTVAHSDGEVEAYFDEREENTKGLCGFFLDGLKRGASYVGVYFGVHSKRYYDMMALTVSDKITTEEVYDLLGQLGQPEKEGPRKGRVRISTHQEIPNVA